MKLMLGMPDKAQSEVVVAGQVGEEGVAMVEVAEVLGAEVDVGAGVEDTLKLDG